MTATVGTVVKVASHDTKLKASEKRLDNHDDQLGKLNVQNASVRSDVKYIKEAIDEVKDKIETLIERHRD